MTCYRTHASAVGRDESLVEPVVPARRSKAPALEVEALVGANHHRRGLWAEGAEAATAGVLSRGREADAWLALHAGT